MPASEPRPAAPAGGLPGACLGADIPRAVRRALRTLRRDIRFALFLRALALLLVAAAAAVLLSLAVDRAFRLSVPGRAAALGIYSAALGCAAWKLLLRPVLRPLPPALLADLLERRFPRLGDRLRSAVDFLRDPSFLDERSGGGEEPGRDEALTRLMKRRVAEEALRELEGLDPGAAVDTARVGSALLVGVATATVLAVLAALSPATWNTWFRRQVLFEDVEWPYRTRLRLAGIEGRSLGVPRGDPLQIRVEVEGEMPARVTITMRFEDQSARYHLAREPGGTFVYEHAAVTEPFSFMLQGGDYRSPPYSVHVLERPRVEALSLTVTPPAYTGLAARSARGDAGDVALPRGSRLAVEIESNKPLRRAWLETEGRSLELSPRSGGGRSFAGEYLPETGGTATVRLEDVEGVPPDQLFRFGLHLVEDTAPVVQARTEDIGAMVTPRARIPIVVAARDDYGLTELFLEAAAGEGEDTAPLREEVLSRLEPGTRDVEERHVWELEPLGIAPEKRLTVRLGATDNCELPGVDEGGAGSRKGHSPVLSFLVVTPQRLGDEFLRRQEEQRRILERILEVEKGVRDQVYELVAGAWRREGALAEETIQGTLALERTERQHGRQLEAVAGAVRQLLREMENNRIGEADELQHLARDIIAPLDELAGEVLPAAAATLGRIRGEGEAARRVEEGLRLAGALEGKIDTLQGVIDGLVKLETFTEIVKRLRGIITAQEEAAAATRRSYERTVEGFLEDVGTEVDPGGAGGHEDRELPGSERKPAGESGERRRSE